MIHLNEKNTGKLGEALIPSLISFSTGAVECDICVLLILVFKTHLYDELKALDNYRDYLQFIALADSSEILNDEGQAVAHRISVGEKELFSIYENILLRES